MNLFKLLFKSMYIHERNIESILLYKLIENDLSCKNVQTWRFEKSVKFENAVENVNKKDAFQLICLIRNQ